jgi:hypothetical protein
MLLWIATDCAQQMRLSQLDSVRLSPAAFTRSGQTMSLPLVQPCLLQYPLACCLWLQDVPDLGWLLGSTHGIGSSEMLLRGQGHTRLDLAEEAVQPNVLFSCSSGLAIQTFSLHGWMTNMMANC